MSSAVPPIADLARFFSEAFSAEELRHFTLSLPDGAALLSGLPGGSSSNATVAHEAATLLHRQAVTRKALFWELLAKARANHTSEVEALQRRFLTGEATFPGYELLGTAGRGRSGTVFQARDGHSGQLRAIKVADPRRGQDERDRLAHEYRVLAGLHHPALLRVFHLVVEPERAWMVCEYLPGGTLQDRIDRQDRWSDHDLARLGRALASALATLHAQIPSVLHRDLKPDNILFDEQGLPHLIDLGHARPHDPERVHGTRGPVTGYIAPELMGYRPVGPSPLSDQYSLCSVLVHAALTGHAEDWSERQEDPRALLSDRSRGLVECLARGMARRPEDRFPRIDDLEATLARLLESEAETEQRQAEDARRAAQDALAARADDAEARLAKASAELQEQSKARAEAETALKAAKTAAALARREVDQQTRALNEAKSALTAQNATLAQSDRESRQQAGARASAEAASREAQAKLAKANAELDRQTKARTAAEAATRDAEARLAKASADLEQKTKALVGAETALKASQAQARREAEAESRARAAAAARSRVTEEKLEQACAELAQEARARSDAETALGETKSRLEKSIHELALFARARARASRLRRWLSILGGAALAASGLLALRLWSVADVSLVIPEGVHAELDGVPWNGSVLSLNAGQHPLRLTAGCDRRDLVLQVLRPWEDAGAGDLPVRAGPFRDIPLQIDEWPASGDVRIDILTAGDAPLPQVARVQLSINGETPTSYSIQVGLNETSFITLREPFCGMMSLKVWPDGVPEDVEPGQLDLELRPDVQEEAALVLLALKGKTPTWIRGLVARSHSAAPLSFFEVAKGEFRTGGPEASGETDKQPKHLVYLSQPFWIGESEVTQAQWRAVVTAAQAAGDTDAKLLKADPSDVKGDTRPVESVNWCEVMRFANALSRLEGLEPAYMVGAACESGGTVDWKEDATGYRLPTEAEWEYAARAGTTTDYSFGDDPKQLCTYAAVFDKLGKKSHPDLRWENADCNDGFADTAPVCSFQRNPWGLCDVHGNVWEWTYGWYADTYNGETSAATPTGSADRGNLPVGRGGSWRSPPADARSAVRGLDLPSHASSRVGLRLARSVRESAVVPSWGLFALATVMEGDTLGAIAKSYYGDSSEWPRILEANMDTLRSGNGLPIGMSLVIPLYPLIQRYLPRAPFWCDLPVCGRATPAEQVPWQTMSP